MKVTIATIATLATIAIITLAIIATSYLTNTQHSNPSIQDSLIEKHPTASFHPVFATFGNAENTYTHKAVPERIDYLMFRAKSHIDMKVGKQSLILYIVPSLCEC